jgi:glutamate-1-semialdehyde 2,1-aminomutase
MGTNSLGESAALFGRAEKVVPGGIHGHQAPAMLVRGEQPYFFDRGDGCRVWDVDGNEYIDFMCSYGPIVLGHHHPKVEEAALAQWRKGDCFNGPSPLWVELAEHLVGITPCADWAAFAKNGSDVCTWAVRIARAHTGRSKVVMASGSYHGAHAWCTPAPGGVTAEDRSNVLTFPYNDSGALEQIVLHQANSIAAIIVTPFRHDAFHDQEMPADGFLETVRRLSDAHGIVFVLDDVRAGFRLHLGGSGELFGVRPDIACYAKALANGYPLAACVGGEEFREAARRVYFTGSYFTAAVPMAAALACLRELQTSAAIEHMQAMGTLFRAGLEDQAGTHDLAIRCTGPPALPFMTFRDDRKFALSRRFAASCSKHGVFLAPYHNWFISAAHRETDVQRALEATDRAFAEVRRSFAELLERAD